MTLLDLLVVLAVILISHFVPMPWGVMATGVVALIIERVLKGERI